MSNSIPSRLGQINSQGDNLALFLKVFGGEVLTTFNRMAYYRERQMRRTIASGKSAQFPVLGTAGAYYHTPGDEILGQTINANEKTIDLEGALIAPIFIPSIDELYNHYDVRAPYAQDIAQALSKVYDQNVSRVIAMAARQTAANVNGVFPNDTIARMAALAGYATDGAVLFNGIIDAGVLMDTRDVPREGRQITVDPIRYALLLKSEKPFDFDLSGVGHENGGYASGMVRRIDGAPLEKTNNYAKANDIANALMPASRAHDFSTSQATIHHNSAVGTVALQDMTMESEYDMRRQGFLTLGKYVVGHGTLRVEAAEELVSAAPAG